MSSISEWSDLMPHEVLIYPKIGTDRFNKPVYGAAVTYSARVVFGLMYIRDKNGETVPASGEMWIATTANIKTEDKVMFLRDTEPSPAEYDQLFLIRVMTFPDENGFHHIHGFFR